MERKPFPTIYITTFILFLFLLTCDTMSPSSGLNEKDDTFLKNMNTDSLPLLIIDSLDTVITMQGSTTTRAFRLQVNYSKKFYFEVTSTSGSCSGISIIDTTYKTIYNKNPIYSNGAVDTLYISKGNYFLLLKINCSTSNEVSISLYIDNSEPDNTRATARMVEINGISLTGTLETYDTDMFKFAAQKDSCYAIVLENSPNTILTLLRPDSSRYGSVSSTNGPSTLTFRCAVSGIYYFTIVSNDYYGGSQKTEYSCSVNTLPVDSYEPDDSIHQAKLLPTDGMFQPHSDFSGDVDWMKFRTPLGYYYLIKVNGSNYGTGIYTDKKVLLTSLNTNDSLFVWGVTPIDSIVFIKTGNEQSSEYSSGSMTMNYYTISATAFPIDTYEPDDNPANAHLILVGQDAFKSALITSDIDWVKFAVNAGGTYDILGTGNGSFVVGVYKSSGLTYVSSRSFGTSNLYTASDNDTVYLKIGERSGTSINIFKPTQATKSPVSEYSIKVNTFQNDPFEYDNNLKSAKPIATDGSIQKRIFTSGDTDVIIFNAVADSSYQISVSSAYRVRLYSDSTTILRTQYNNSNPSSGITLKWMCTRSGIYYFDAINPYMGDSVLIHYTVSVKAFKNDAFEPDNIMSMATLLDTSKTPVTHTLIQNDIDWYKFTATPSIVMKITGTGTKELPVFACTSKNDTLYFDDSFSDNLYSTNFDSITDIFIRIGSLSEKIIKAHESDSLNYNYSIQLIPLYNDMYEPDRTFKTARAIELNGAAQNRILLYKEKDHIKLDAVKDSSYKITLSNILKMSLLNASGGTLFSYTWSNAGTSNSVKWTCLESGSYYIRLDSTSQNWETVRDYPRFSYTVSFESTARGDTYEPDNTPATATLIKADTVKQHHSLFILDVDWVKFKGVKGTEYQFFYEQQSSNSPNVSMALYLDDGRTLFQNSSVSGFKWNCPADGDYCLKFWVDTKNALSTSEWEYTTYIQKGEESTDTGSDIRSTAEVGYLLVQQSTIVSTSTRSWFKINLQNDNMYQVCIKSLTPVTCTLFGNDLSTISVPQCSVTRNIGNQVVQVFTWKPLQTEMHYFSLNNINPNMLLVNFFIIPFNNDAYEPDTLVNQLHSVSTDSIPIFRTLSINDTSDAVLFHGIDGKSYKLGLTSDSVTLKVKTPSTTGAKLTLLESAPGMMRVSCTGTGDFVVYFFPFAFSGRVLNYMFYIKEE